MESDPSGAIRRPIVWRSVAEPLLDPGEAEQRRGKEVVEG
jgi:hypothetical protein